MNTNPNLQDRIEMIELHNARSWHTAGLKLHPHVNVIVGESDSGKSNLVRSIRSVVENDTAASLLRSGCETGRVDVCMADGFEVTLTKSASGKVNEYTVRQYTGVEHDGMRECHVQDFERVGRDVPQEVSEALGIGPLVLGAMKVSLHIGDQFEPRFCLADKPSVVARIIGGAAGIDEIVSAAVRAGKDSRQARIEAKRLRQQRADAERSLLATKDRVKSKRLGGRLREGQEAAQEALGLVQAAREAEGVVQAARTLGTALGAATAAQTCLNRLAALEDHTKQADAYRQDAHRLTMLADEVAVFAGELSGHEVELHLLSQQRTGLEVALREIESAIGKCPKCGRLKL